VLLPSRKILFYWKKKLKVVRLICASGSTAARHFSNISLDRFILTSVKLRRHALCAVLAANQSNEKISALLNLPKAIPLAALQRFSQEAASRRPSQKAFQLQKVFCLASDALAGIRLPLDATHIILYYFFTGSCAFNS
jgi:hypothetical protein